MSYDILREVYLIMFCLQRNIKGSLEDVYLISRVQLGDKGQLLEACRKFASQIFSQKNPL